jgi:hypothetical protein
MSNPLKKSSLFFALEKPFDINRDALGGFEKLFGLFKYAWS